MRLALALVILGSCVLAAGCWRIYTNTWDEPEHIAAGIELLDKGYYEYDTEHPPLARGCWPSAPFSPARIPSARRRRMVPEGKDILYADGNYGLYLTLARAGNLPFLVLLLLVTWLWARRLFAAGGAALLSLVLLFSVPPILGHAALATLDVAAAATCLLALYTLENWLDSGRWEEAVLFGVTSGFAIATKFSAVPFIALSFLALGLVQGLNSWRAARGTGPSLVGVRSRSTGMVLAALAALVPLLAVYGMRSPDVSGVEVRFEWAVYYLISQGGLARAVGALVTRVVAAGTDGSRERGDRSQGAQRRGHRSYLLGQVSLNGWWYFYLVTLAVKTPLPLLAGGSSGWCASRARAGARATAGRCATRAGARDPGLRERLQPHQHRHPARANSVPFPGAGRRLPRVARMAGLPGAQRCTPAHGGDRGADGAAAVAGEHAVAAYPDYLPYFNETVREPRRVLVDSDLDWGQDLRRLEIRAAQLQSANSTWPTTGPPTSRASRCRRCETLKPRQVVSGWVAVSALARTRRPSDFQWLDAYQPLERIGHTIDLYYIP